MLESLNYCLINVFVVSTKGSVEGRDDICKDFNMLSLFKVRSSKRTGTHLFVNHNHAACCCLCLYLGSLCIMIYKQRETVDNTFGLFSHRATCIILCFIIQPLCKPSSRKHFSYLSEILNWGLQHCYTQISFQDLQTSFYVIFIFHSFQTFQLYFYDRPKGYGFDYT